jgi:glycerophosphoryl diester phosphodiesterase
VPSGELAADIPTLRAALEACDGLVVNVEIKNLPGDLDFDDSDEVARAVPGVVADLGLTARTLVSSFNLRTVDVVHRVDPALATAWLVVGLGDLSETVTRTVEHGHRALHPHDLLVDERLVRACHDAGLAVNVWTVDDPMRMAELVALGVDGICTNVPDVARTAVDGTG